MKKRFDSYRWILGYEVKDDSIIIHYRGGGTNVFGYTKDTEISTLKKMKEDLLESKRYKELKRPLMKSFAAIAIINLVAFLFQSVNFVSGLIIGNFNTSSLLFAISNAMLLLSMGAQYLTIHFNMKDIKKGELFIENEEKLNKMIETNVKAMENQLAPSREFQLYEELGSPKLTLNTIDDIPLKKLKQIVQYIKDEDVLGTGSSKAFEETLEAFEKVKKKKKLKR